MKNSGFLGRIPTMLPSGEFLGNPLEEDRPFPDRPSMLTLYPWNHDPDRLLREALKRDLSAVERIRFDPVNACNLRCVFCPHDLERPHAQLSLDLLEEVLSRVTDTCRRIVMGCAFEPTMAKNFTAYGELVKRTASRFKSAPVFNILTNAILLDRRDIAPFADIVSWLHISCHSHLPEKYLALQPRGDFWTVEANIRRVRQDYPNLRVHLECVVTPLNLPDAIEYIRWGFGAMDVNTINLRRVGTDLPMKANSELARSRDRHDDQTVPDADWAVMVDRVLAHFPASISTVSVAAGDYTSVVELDKSDVIGRL
jgi:hypothetical protein